MNKILFDECLPREAALEYRDAGLDAVTVGERNLVGTKDMKLAHLANAEGRAFITLDKELGNIQMYPPADFAGLILLRPQNQLKPHVLALLRTLLPLLLKYPVAGELWVVEEDRVRIR